MDKTEHRHKDAVGLFREWGQDSSLGSNLYLILARIKKELKSQYSITEIATLVSVSALERHELKELLMTSQEKLLRSNQNQHVKELQLESFN